ncbi:MAG: hypothetical protein KDC27_03290 [Acidobacteria bacterium]|nr:hypothetical protein [Acidobacteriota bacterium]
MLRSQQDTLGKVIAGTAAATQRPALPAASHSLPILTCVYQSAGGGVAQSHHWVGAPPAWHRAIPAGHPLNQLVSAPVESCPASLTSSAAAAPRAAAVAPPPAPQPQPQSARQAVPLPSFEPTQKDFRTEGRALAKVYAALFAGEFGAVPYGRESVELQTLLDAYIDGFGRNCAQQLPANKVEVTEEVCVAETVTRNGYGVEVNRYCSQWRTRGTGVYADPELYGVSKAMQRVGKANSIGTVMSMMQGGLGGVMQLAQRLKTIKSDVPAMVKQNECSHALRRFQDNLQLYASGKSAKRLDGAAPAAAPAPTAESQSFPRLIDDLISANSQTWAANRYIRGSISGVNVSSTDPQGRPARIRASYAFDGLSGRSAGTVEVEFSEGVPRCLYYWDRPDVCRAPDRGIVARYTSGAYTATPN